MSKLIVLGLLKHKNMHGYEIQSVIQESRMDQWANVLSGSIYYALNKMEKEGVIEAVKEERTGARLRKIYEITSKGHEEYDNLLRQSLKESPHSLKSDFTVALALIEQLPKEEGIHILHENLQALKQQKEAWKRGKESKEKTTAYSPLMALSFNNTLQILEADIEMISQTITYLESK